MNKVSDKIFIMNNNVKHINDSCLQYVGISCDGSTVQVSSCL